MVTTFYFISFERRTGMEKYQLSHITHLLFKVCYGGWTYFGHCKSNFLYQGILKKTATKMFFLKLLRQFKTLLLELAVCNVYETYQTIRSQMGTAISAILEDDLILY